MLDLKISTAILGQAYVEPQLLVCNGGPSSPDQIKADPLRSGEGSIDILPFLIPENFPDRFNGRRPKIPILTKIHVRPMRFKEGFPRSSGESQDFNHLNAKMESRLTGPVCGQGSVKGVALFKVLLNTSRKDGMVNLGSRGFGKASFPPRNGAPTRKGPNTVGGLGHVHVEITHGEELVSNMREIASNKFFGDLEVINIPINRDDGANAYGWQPEANSGQPPLVLPFAEFKDVDGMYVLPPQYGHP